MRKISRSPAAWLTTTLVLVAAALVTFLGDGLTAQDSRAREWRRIDPKEIQDNPVKLFGKDWIALAAGKQGDMNAMTIGWGGLGTLWGMDNAVVTVYVEKTRHTHKYMDENEYFTVTAFPEEYRGALRYLGGRSGRDGDKIPGSGLTVSYTELGNPIFDEGRLVLECRKIYSAPFDPAGMGERGKRIYAPERGMQFHTIFIGEVVNAWVK